jgi:hypothetical protein
MTRSIPKAALTQMRERVPVWVEYNTIGIAYHGRQWLIDNGYRPPDKKTMVGYCRMKDFIEVSRDQPCVVLHEQAHGYDHRYLRQDSTYFSSINFLYMRARDSGKFDSVLCRKKGYKKHYGMTNSAEYFAENSEAYFGANDFYPFVRAELKEYDPDMYHILELAWGVDRKQEQQRMEFYREFIEKKPKNSIGNLSSVYQLEHTSNYKIVDCQGWKVYINPSIAKDKPYADKVMALLEYKLHLIKIYLPERAIQKLQTTKIWIERNNSLNQNVVFYPLDLDVSISKQNPDKAGSIEIGNTENFLYWDKLQPWIVFNQLCRVYYQEQLKKNTNFFAAVWQQRIESKKYLSVLRFDGEYVRHPGLNSREDFFAEMSESCFGINNHYPFLRFELRENDPELYQTIMQIYGAEIK